MGNNKLDILGIIPARGGSKGIEKKNIKMLGDKPLIEYTFDSAKQSRRLTRIILSTDSPEIAGIGRLAEIEVPFLRPPGISQDDSPAIDYVLHALNYLKDEERYEPQIIVLLQPTTPFRSPKDIDECIDTLVASGADSIVSVSMLPSKYHPGWQLLINEHNELSIFTGDEWNSIISRRQQLQPTYTRNGAVYAFRKTIFQETGSIYGGKVLAYVMSEEFSINIDDANDWLIAESFIKKKCGG